MADLNPDLESGQGCQIRNHHNDPTRPRRPGGPNLHLVLIVVLGALALAACSSERRDGIAAPGPEPTVQASTESTVTPEPEPTATHTPSPAPEATATPEPTATPSPQPTPEPVPTSTPAPAPEPLDAPYPVECDGVDREPDEDLLHVIEERLGDYAAGFGIVVHELTGGAYAEVNPDQSYYGASLYKTAVMYEVLRQVDDGRLSLDQYVTIDTFYASQDLGTLRALGWGPGTQITIQQALEAAITISDNATAFLLGDLVGWVRMDDTLHDLGAVNTQFSWEDLPTTAGDTAIMLEAIACARGVATESSQLMLENLAGQLINNRLPMYLPDEAVVAHKTGNWPDANHNAGIVYGPDAVYIVSVLSYYPGADEQIALLSRDIYEYFHPDVFIDDDSDGERAR